MIPHEIRVLCRKEWRQLRANRTALVTSMIPPVMFLLFVPQLLIAAVLSDSPETHGSAPIDLGLLGDVSRDPHRVPFYLLPIFCGIAGMVVPIVLAVHSVVSERESRTFELLIALPVRLSQVLIAKMLTVGAFTFAVCGACLSVTLAHMFARSMASPLEALVLYLELFAAIAAGTASALTIGFLSKDFRTAQNVSAAYIVPVIFVSVLLAVLVGGGALRPFVLGCFYGLWAAGLGATAARQRSFEQLMR